jgi:DNA-binding winged helix-turn-helix (wHTH) protein
VTTCFGPFSLNGDTRQLRRDGREIHLAPKALDLLLTLVRERPNVVSTSDLQQRLWPETFVAEANLSNLVAEIRAALDDRARPYLYIRTAHGFGYAFCGSGTTVPASGDPAADQSQCWLEWDQRRFPLPAGEHAVGRGRRRGHLVRASRQFR